MSGNGPLVAVLTEALAQDNYKKCRDKGEKKKISDSRREVGKAIQMIHRYRDNVLAKIKNPVENETLEIDPKKAIKIEKIGLAKSNTWLFLMRRNVRGRIKDCQII